MHVYRVETAEGDGPYMGIDFDWAIHVGSPARSHPAPDRDGCGDGTRRGYACGFRSLGQGARWFAATSALAEAMNRHGETLAVSVYAAEDVLEGGAQVMFDPATARLVDVLPLGALTGWATE